MDASQLIGGYLLVTGATMALGLLASVLYGAYGLKQKARETAIISILVSPLFPVVIPLALILLVAVLIRYLYWD